MKLHVVIAAGPVGTATALHLAAGTLLIAVPIALTLALTGSALTAATGLVTGAILAGSAIAGFRWLAQAPALNQPGTPQTTRNGRPGKSAPVALSPGRPSRGLHR